MSKYGSGMTNMKDLLDYYNNPKTDEQDKNNMYKDLSSNSDMAQKLENQKGLDDYDNLSSRFDTVSSGMSSRFDTINKSIENVPENYLSTVTNCYNPTCTIDVVYQKNTTSTSGKAVGDESPSRKRVFRACNPTALVQSGDNETMEYKCPLNSDIPNTQETLVLQPDGKECSCKNTHTQSTNLQKVIVGVKLAETINGKICPKDENDNATMDNITNKRQECRERCNGDSNYSQCINSCNDEGIDIQ